MLYWPAMSQPSELESRTVSKIFWKLMPLMFVCYIVAFLDRVNVNFAGLHLGKDLGFTESIYSTGAGIFFIGYFIFEVPSNLILERIGARIWIARIMVVWGIISSLMMFVNGKAMFYSLRFLLGAAEAGFFPGMILYFTYWFPKAYRSRIVSYFMMAAVTSSVVGQPLSGWLLDHPAFGMKGWQWLFLVEGIPSILLGFVVLWYLPNGPRSCSWLKPDELAWLSTKLEEERAAQGPKAHLSLKQALTHPMVLMLSLVYFLNVAGGYGVDFYGAKILRKAYASLTDTQLGFLSALPALIALPLMVLHGRSSDRLKENRWHVAIPVWVFTVGLVILSMDVPPFMIMVGMTCCVAGRWCAIGPFWGLPTAFLAGTAAAGGIAMINSIGNLGGYVGPKIMGELVKGVDQFSLGLRILAVVVFFCGVVVLMLKVKRPDASIPEPEPAPPGASK